MRSAIFALPLLASCNLVKLAADQTADVLEVAAPANNMESDVQFAREAAPGQLKTVEGFLMASPENRKMLAILAQGYCEYAFGFLQDDVEALVLAGKTDEATPLVARTTAFYQRCTAYGLRLLGSDWDKAFHSSPAAFEKHVKSAEKSDVPGMFWTALGTASAIDLNRDNIEMIADLPKAQLLFERVLALDEAYYNGGAHLAMGMIQTSMSPALGGNPEAGKKHFERVVELTFGKFLMPKVLLAASYGTITQNQEFFHATLTQVLDTPPSVWPEQRLANELAHIRAKRYLAHEKELF